MNSFGRLGGKAKMMRSCAFGGYACAQPPSSDRLNIAHMTGSIASIFESFRQELDEHHDRRERLIKVIEF